MGGTGRQLCFLFGGYLGERCFYSYCGGGYCGGAFYPGMAWGKDVLQYHLSGGYRIGVLVQILLFQTGD